jgi:iron complex transport system substrate-binding protein
MLFAIGAGPQVKAVDDQSNYPPEAPRSSLSGFQPNIEAIAKENPDLVVASDDTAGLVDGLAKLKIPVLIQPAATTLDDSYAEIGQLGQVTGNTDKASAVVSDMKSRIAAIVSSLPKRTTPITYFHELDDTLYTATSKTFIGQIYSLLGLQNIADAADTKGTGYPQLSAEYVVKANPRLIFLADTKCCKQNTETVKARPGWSGIAAVIDGGVVNLDDDIASRWGPRIVDYLQQVAQAVAKVSP